MISSILVLGGLGLVFGIILAYASKKFEVKIDEKVSSILKILPNANCGGCGFLGCTDLAKAIVNGEASVDSCPIGGAECASKIGKIMGVSIEGRVEKSVAKVICKGNINNANNKFIYDGIDDCRAANILNSGAKSCKFGCLGLGTCKNVCKFQAIDIIDGVAVIDESKCVMCGNCIKACPKKIIIKKPINQEIVVECNNREFGKVVKEKCKVGCIGCKICLKTCKYDAIEFEENIAKINYDKCVGCMDCTKKCPTKAIQGVNIKKV